MFYRFSTSTSARFDVVRPDMDILVVGGKVHPGNGGVSVFNSLELHRPPNKTFGLESSAALSDGLTVIDDLGSHCLIAPSREMAFTDFKRALVQLNSEAKAVPATADSAFVLARHSGSFRSALRFVYEALVSVWRERIVVDGWDENDYAYIALLARDLDGGQLTLEALRWEQGDGWTRPAAFTAQAVRAFMAWSTAKAVGDEDLEADAGNDNAYLMNILRLNPSVYPDNPYAVREM
ncbi:hypothetical protein AURDEDRAFT_99817 [Auricularia subglabra TFB-10046 SS5]|nr:hypothetical protein AURDEDRAFT_99817 [Auricularia subglabra TFB-10046 SS5]